MSPLEFMQRLAALVPRPRLHLIRFHGVLAPNAKLRALVVPQEAQAPAQAAPAAECEAGCAHHRPVRLSWAKLLKRVFVIDLEHWRCRQPTRRRAKMPPPSSSAWPASTAPRAYIASAGAG